MNPILARTFFSVGTIRVATAILVMLSLTIRMNAHNLGDYRSNRNADSVLASDADGNLNLAVFSSVSTAGSAPQDLLRIFLVKGQTHDETVVYFVDGATDGFDNKFDAYKMRNGTFNLSTVQADGENLVINAMPAIDCRSTISLNIQNASPGNYQLNFSGYESFPEGLIITLLDNLTATSVNVRDPGSYNFSITAAPGSYGPNRFTISFVTPPVKEDFVLSVTPTCVNSVAMVHVSNSQKAAMYVAMLNGLSVSVPVVGTGGEIVLAIPQNTMEPGQNLIKVRASMTGCSSVWFDQTFPLSAIGIIDVGSVHPGKTCRNGTVTLSASGSPDNGYYNWYESIQSELAVDNQHDSVFVTPVLFKSQTYYVSVVNILGCESSRKPVLAEIIQPDPVQIIQSGGHLVSNYSNGNQWYFNHKIIDGAIDSVFIPTMSGEYTVEVLVDGCIVTSADFAFVVTGIEPYDPTEGLILSPNPATDKVVIEISNSFGIIRGINIVNMLGKVVSSLDSHDVNERKKVEVMLTNYPAGVYIVRINGDRRTVDMRFVKL